MRSWRALLILVVGLMVMAPTGRAESFTQLGRKMHDLSNFMMALQDPERFGEGKAPADIATDAQALAIDLRDHAEQYVPDPIKNDPKLVAAFRSSFDVLAASFGSLHTALALPDTDATKADQVDALMKQIDSISNAAHDSFTPPKPPMGRPRPPPPPSPIAPIDRTRDAASEDTMTGDNPGPAHRVLWAKPAFIATLPGGVIPPASENADVVVVGGGMSGLLSAYELQSHNPVVLDQAANLGGNSRGESWGGVDYSIGATYFDIPEKDSRAEKLLADIGLKDKYVTHSPGDDPVVINGVRYEKVWENGASAGSKDQFVALRQHFQDMAAGKNGLVYPAIPVRDPAQRDYINKLDGMTMRAYLEKIVGGPLNPDVEYTIDRYFWSAFAGTIDEVGAATGLNFFVGDFDKVAIAPGGNAAIAQGLFDKLQAVLPANSLRGKAMVFDVKVDDTGANVAYVDAGGKVKVIRAKSVVMACPKFVAAKLIDDLEPARLDAIKALRYRSYLVANVLINQKVDPAFYDIFFAEKDASGKLDTFTGAGRVPGATDVVYANFANVDPQKTVLTLYRPVPFDQARPELLMKTYEQLRADFAKQVQTSLLPTLGIDQSKLAGIRISRWGHPIPLSATGLIAQGRPEALTSPFKGRVVFVNQDNWALPSYETTVAESGHLTIPLHELLGDQVKCANVLKTALKVIEGGAGQ